MTQSLVAMRSLGRNLSEAELQDMINEVDVDDSLTEMMILIMTMVINHDVYFEQPKWKENSGL